MKQKRQNKLNNHGFSLLELIVTLAVMAVVSVGSITTYRTVSRTNVNKSASSVNDYLSLAREKAKTTSAYEWNMTIEAQTKGVKVSVQRVNWNEGKTALVTDVLKSETLPTNVSVNVSYGTDKVTIGNGGGDLSKVTFVFSPLTGSVKRIYRNGEAAQVIDITKNDYCDINLVYKTKNKAVRLYYLTGKHVQV